MSHKFKPSSVLDKHARQFYEGVPIILYHNAVMFGLKPQFARFWFHSRTPYRAWVVGWECKGAKPAVYLVDVSRMSISYQPVDPPPMPDWTHDTIRKRRLAQFWDRVWSRDNHRGNDRGSA